MRVLVVSQYYPPENVPIPAAIAFDLVSRGHDVQVLTGYPNYPSGKLFAGYRQHWRGHESDGSVPVCRVPLFTNHSKNPLARMANYLSFGFSAATARRVATDIDVIYVYATQMTAALGPWLWRFVGGPPYVLHVQDLWPDSIIGSSLSRGFPARFTTAILSPWLRSVYRRAGAVVAIAPTMLTTLIRRGAPAERASLVFNWADERSIPDCPGQTSRPAGRRKTNVLYAGNVGDMQDLELAIVAADLARDAGVHLKIVGSGVALPRLRDLAAELGVTNVSFAEPVSPDLMPDIYREADYALITLKDLRVFQGTIPSKFQTILANGVPVITNVAGDVRTLVEDLRLGFAAEPASVESLEEAFRAAAALDESDRCDMSYRALESYAEQFSQGAGTSAIEATLARAASARKPRQRWSSRPWA